MAAPSEQLQYQSSAVGQLIEGVKPDQWDNPTGLREVDGS